MVSFTSMILGFFKSICWFNDSLPVPVLYELVEAVKVRMSDAGMYNKDGSGQVLDILGFGVLFIESLLIVSISETATCI